MTIVYMVSDTPGRILTLFLLSLKRESKLDSNPSESLKLDAYRNGEADDTAAY